MKWILRFITFTILAVGAGFAFFLKVENGQPTLALPDAGNWSIPDLPIAGTARITTSYKWQDPKGHWHYGDTPPENLPYTELKVNNQTNVIPGVSDAQRATLNRRETLPTAISASAPQNRLSPSSPADSESGLHGGLNILHDAKAVRAQMDARNTAMEAITDRHQ